MILKPQEGPLLSITQSNGTTINTKIRSISLIKQPKYHGNSSKTYHKKSLFPITLTSLTTLLRSLSSTRSCQTSFHAERSCIGSKQSTMWEKVSFLIPSKLSLWIESGASLILGPIRNSQRQERALLSQVVKIGLLISFSLLFTGQSKLTVYCSWTKMQLHCISE